MRNKKSLSLRERFKTTFRYHTLSLQIIIPFMILITLTITFLSLAFYYYNINDLEQMSIQNTRRQLADINFSVDSYIDNIKNIGQVVSDNQDVTKLLAFYTSHGEKVMTPELEEKKALLVSRVASHLKIVSNTRKEIASIVIIPKEGAPILSDRTKRINLNSNYRKSDWFLHPFSEKDKVYVSSSHVQNLIDGEYRWVISISEAIIDPDTKDVTGVILIDLQYAAIEEIFNNTQLSKEGYVYLVDEEGRIIFHPQQQLVYSGIKAEPIDTILSHTSEQPLQQQNTIYLRSSSSVTGWNTIGVINSKELLGNRLEIIVFYALIALFSLLCATAIIFIISKNITKPIRQLENSMDKARTGDLTVRSSIKANNEIGRLGDSFNIMISQIQNLIDKTVAVEQEKRKSEIKALQAQINPHFLYNTLDTIIWMSASGKNDEVVEVTSALAHLFRTSISQGDEFVTVAIELENIKNYLVIQKMRYKDKLNYDINVVDDVEHILTPRLILQPIVENALYHGIKPLQDGGTISINIFRKDDLLIYKIDDNGVGMSEEQIRNVFKVYHDDEGGIGIINVHERIQLLFGKQYGLYYSKNKDGGTSVEIRIPIIVEEGFRA